MSFNSNPSRVEYVVNTKTTTFTFNFKIFEPENLVVYKIPSGTLPDDETNKLLLNVDYTVSINGDLGGFITLLNTTTIHDIIIIQRTLSIDRVTDFVNNGGIYSDVLNNDQDYQTYLISDNEIENARHLKLPVTAVGVSSTIPTPTNAAILRWADDGKSIVNDVNLAEDLAAYNADRIVYDNDRDVYDTDRIVYNNDRAVYDADRLVYDADRAVYGADRAVYDADRLVYDNDRDAYDADRLVYEADRAVYDADRDTYDADRLVYDNDRDAYDADSLVYDNDRVVYDTSKADFDTKYTVFFDTYFRADRYLSSQNIANMIYTDNNLIKIRYITDTDTDYEILTYTNGNLTQIDHYIGAVLQGSSVLSYINNLLTTVIYTEA